MNSDDQSRPGPTTIVHVHLTPQELQPLTRRAGFTDVCRHVCRPVRPARARPRCPARRRCTSCTARTCRGSSCSWFTAVVASRAPLAPSGWPSAIAPPFGLTRGSSSAMPRSRSTARPCAANASFSSITSICVELQARQREHLAHGRRRAEAHDARRDAGGRHAKHAGLRRQPVLRCARLVGQQQRARRRR